MTPDELRDRLAAAGAAASAVVAWSNGPGERYAEHRHDYDKVLVCEEGSIDFLLGDLPVPLMAGDRLDLPAGTDHAAAVGAPGVRCYEAHLPAGSLPGPRAIPGWASASERTARSGTA